VTVGGIALLATVYPEARYPQLPQKPPLDVVAAAPAPAAEC
jgi:hypothetical protein